MNNVIKKQLSDKARAASTMFGTIKLKLKDCILKLRYRIKLNI